MRGLVKKVVFTVCLMLCMSAQSAGHSSANHLKLQERAAILQNYYSSCEQVEFADIEILDDPLASTLEGRESLKVNIGNFLKSFARDPSAEFEWHEINNLMSSQSDPICFEMLKTATQGAWGGLGLNPTVAFKVLLLADDKAPGKIIAVFYKNL